VAIANPGDPGDALDPGGREVFGPDPDERRPARKKLRAHLATDPRIHGQHALSDDPEQQRQHHEARESAVDPDGDMADFLPCQPGRV
jgi:hypothetical protein